MTDFTFQLVPFHGHQILAGTNGALAVVPMKRFVSTLGLKWAGAYQRIMRDEVLREGVCVMQTPSDGGMQEQMCLPIELIPGFMFGAEPKKCAPEVRERVSLFRREAYRVLYEAFFGGAGMAGARRQIVSEFPTPFGGGVDDRTLVRLIAALKAEPVAEVRRTLHQLLGKVCHLLGVDTPPAEVIVTPATIEAQRHRATVGLFWERYALLEQGEGRSLNHHRKPGLIAVSLVEYEQRCADARLRCPPLTELRAALRFSEQPRFIEAGTVKSQHGATTHCWIFADESAQPTLFPEPTTAA